MTRKDYEAIAAVINEVFEDVGPTGPGLIGNTQDQADAARMALACLASRLADDVFAPDNDRFNTDRFFAAAIPS